MFVLNLSCNCNGRQVEGMIEAAFNTQAHFLVVEEMMTRVDFGCSSPI